MVCGSSQLQLQIDGVSRIRERLSYESITEGGRLLRRDLRGNAAQHWLTKYVQTPKPLPSVL